MAKLKIEGNKILNGEVTISGAKNSAVALIPAAVLSCGKSIIYNVPEITDIEYIIKIMELLNCKIEHKNDTLYIDSSEAINNKIPEDLSVQMRASYYFMGALLSRFKRCEIAFPGGCKIGNRPIDLHIKGFEALGATVTVIKGKYIIEAQSLKGTTIYLDFPSVGATINLMLAATGAEGETIIDNAAKEPEIVNVASYLISMGAKIAGAGTDKITIEGSQELNNGVVEVIPDRIEAGTYLIIGALTAEKLIVKKAIKEHVDALLKKFNEVGVKYEINEDNIIIYKSDNLKATNLKTLVFPGFPTDLQQPFTTLLTQANGISTITESIFESRFRNTEYLNLMGANTKIIKDNLLEISGPTKLYGKEVISTDLRAGASLMVAALIAEGQTIIANAELIMRGYGNVVEKLKNIGAKIQIIE
jgi:UDP-N-acetylglucosamine 1-carboxyvinyltransferase